MEYILTDIDRQLIEREATRKTYREIAFLVDCPEEAVATVITELVAGRGIVSFQQLQDQKKAARAARPRTVKPKAPKPPREKKAKPVVISRVLTTKTPAAPPKREQAKFRTITRDFSQMQLVRINSKTHVYAPIGSDPEAVRKKYLENLKSDKSSPYKK